MLQEPAVVDIDRQSALIDAAADRVVDRAVDVQRIDDRDEIVQVLTDLAAGARHEVCSMLPGGPYGVEYLRSSWSTDVATLQRGVALNALYQSDAARSPEVLRYLTEFTRVGAEVRVTGRLPHRTIIVDRRVAVVGVVEDSLSVPFLLVREPAMVRSFHAQFVGQWRTSPSVGLGPEDALASDTVREMLEILQLGVTDDVAAKRLGVSVRTVRRRVAAVMELLGASSRFEAGVRAAQAGWL